jgi:membrane-anchored mycosin MYCP
VRGLIPGVALALVTSGAWCALAPAPAYAVDNDCAAVTATDLGDTDRGSLPLDLMHVRSAQDVVEELAPRGRTPVRVAVLDSGVLGEVGGAGPIPLHARTTDVTHHSDLTYYHGTAVAGLIAGAPGPGGPVGIAPDAEIVDVRVYDEGPETAQEGAVQLTVDGLVQGLRWVAGHAGEMNIKVANVSLFVVPSSGAAKRELAGAVADVRAQGVVVVASSGNRPKEGEPYDSEFGQDKPKPGEDAADYFYPAGFPEVITANSTGEGGNGVPPVDPATLVLLNSRTDVAVPTQAAVSYGLSGDTCLLPVAATSWAAAEVSGVLALLWERYPDDTDEQIVARLLNTANGTTDNPTPLTGVGVVQPYEALTRPIDPRKHGQVAHTVTLRPAEVRAVAPEPDEDLLADTREKTVWWGLLGGGFLVVALLLRPVLARRRR